MVSIIKVSVRLHSPFTPFLSIFSSICFIALTPFSKDTHFVLIGNSHCHFLKNRKCIQCINNVYKSNQVTSTTWCMSANKQNLRISNLPYPNSCWKLSSTLDCAPLFLQFSFLCVSSGLPPEEQVLNPPTHPASVLLILNPQIHHRSRPLQTKRTTIHPHYFSSDILSTAPCRLLLVGPEQNMTYR